MLRPTMDPVPNLPLLRKVLDHIDAHPEEWDQGVWASPCGTAYCVAGHAVLMTGHTINSLSGCENGLLVSEVARMELGLTWFEQYDLFEGTNDRNRVQAVAERIALRAGEQL